MVDNNNWDKVIKVLDDMGGVAFKGLHQDEPCRTYGEDCSKCPYTRYCTLNRTMQEMVINIATNNPVTPMGVLLLLRPDVQEIVEHCLSYFADRLFDGGSEEWAEVETLTEDIGCDDEKLVEVFNLLGYNKEDR